MKKKVRLLLSLRQSNPKELLSKISERKKRKRGYWRDNLSAEALATLDPESRAILLKRKRTSLT